MTPRLSTFLLPLAVLGLSGLASQAAAQAGGWVQCVARSSNSGTLYVGEPAAGADPAQVAKYRAEFIKAGRAAGAPEAELGPDTAFCFVAPRQADLSRLLADSGKPCPSCSAPYRQSPVAWDFRDILPVEIAAGPHLTTLVMSEPPAPPAAAIPASTSAPAPETPAEPPPPPHPLASARWQALLCGGEVRVSYAFEAPADSLVQGATFHGAIRSAPDLEAPFEETLDRSAVASPSCASPKFVRLADLSTFSKGLPSRGEARLAALRQRLEGVTLELAPPPPPPEPALPPTKVAKATPAKTPAKPAAAPPPVAAPPTAVIQQASAPVRAAPTPVKAVAIAASQQPVADPGSQAQASAQLNADIARRNAAIDARNTAASADYDKRMAAYKAAQDSFAAAQSDYEKSRQEHDRQVTEAARQKAEWEAKVKACNAGDRAACAQ